MAIMSTLKVVVPEYLIIARLSCLMEIVSSVSMGLPWLTISFLLPYLIVRITTSIVGSVSFVILDSMSTCLEDVKDYLIIVRMQMPVVSV